MARESAELAMMLLGVTSAVVLVAYGLIAFNGSAGTDSIFWLFAALFIVYIAWDTRRHLRTIRSRHPPRE